MKSCARRNKKIGARNRHPARSGLLCTRVSRLPHAVINYKIQIRQDYVIAPFRVAQPEPEQRPMGSVHRESSDIDSLELLTRLNRSKFTCCREEPSNRLGAVYQSRRVAIRVDL